MKKQITQKTQIKKGKIYQVLDSSNDVTSTFTSSYYVVKEVNEEKGEAKILIVNRNKPKDILDNDEVIISFQPLDYVRALDDEPVTLKIRYLEKLNLKEVK